MLAKNLLTFDLKFLKIGSDYYSFVKKHPKPKSMSACPFPEIFSGILFSSVCTLDEFYSYSISLAKQPISLTLLGINMIFD